MLLLMVANNCNAQTDS